MTLTSATKQESYNLPLREPRQNPLPHGTGSAEKAIRGSPPRLAATGHSRPMSVVLNGLRCR